MSKATKKLLESINTKLSSYTEEQLGALDTLLDVMGSGGSADGDDAPAVDWDAIDKKDLKKLGKAAAIDSKDADEIKTALQELAANDLDDAADKAGVAIPYVGGEEADEAEEAPADGDEADGKKSKKDKKKKKDKGE